MKILITGITGTLGTVVARKSSNVWDQVYGISRDEQKQRLLPEEYKTRLCDIRDPSRLSDVFAWAKPDIVFHFAALKCIDTIEENPTESIETNIHGTINVCREATKHGAKIVFTSTDKAVEPINVYGNCKAIAERIVLQHGGVVCRYGNVFGSRGSVVPFFAKLINEGKSLPITSTQMTRFWMHINQAANAVMSCAEKSSQVFIPTVKAAPLVEIARAIAEHKGAALAYHEVGLRPGEKLHESIEPGHTSQEKTMSDEEIMELVRESL